MRRICPYALPNHPNPRNNATTALVRCDSLAEGSEFELPVPIYEQSDDSIRLSLVTSRRNCKALLPRSALLVRFRRRVTHSNGDGDIAITSRTAHAGTAEGQGLAAARPGESERSVSAALRKVLDDPSAIAVVLKAVARGASWLPRPAAGRHGSPTGGAYRPGNCSNEALYPWTGQAQKRVVGIE